MVKPNVINAVLGVFMSNVIRGRTCFSSSIACAFCQLLVSGRCRRTKYASMTGTPNMKAARHPANGITIAANNAATNVPICPPTVIQADICPRRSLGKASATSAIPIPYSPPAPSPTINRKT